MKMPGVDVKQVWEPARFAWAYDLVRAYLLTSDDRYARALHERVAEWCHANPPFAGVHWSCGQETTVRAVALLYAEANLATAPSSDRAAMDRLAAVLAASGERVADAIGYAISQRNNHAISEAVGLLALGARFRGSHPEAARWYRNGRRLLERLIREQFAEDGWYIQHSFTYMRLALDQCVIAQRVLNADGETLSASAVTRLRAAVALLRSVIDPASGVVPNHGANDGAFVHPITLARYRDFRPVLTAACASFGFEYPCELAVDNEVLAWLGRAAPPRSTAASAPVQCGASGWAAARVGDACVFVRAGRYTSRPGHLDPLHVDVRFGSREVIVDPGTFAYSAPAPWRNGLSAAAVHNGVIVDDVESGVRGPRFLWYVWPSARIVSAELEEGAAVIVAEVPGRVRRVVRVTSAAVTIEDTILAGDARRARLRWLLHPQADAGSVRVEGGSRVLDAREGATVGWFSPHYGERIPSRSIEVERAAAPGLRIVTRITNDSTMPTSASLSRSTQ
jgi:hypothetical protein